MRAMCIKCWNAEAVVKMHLDASGVFECEQCGETFEKGEVREVLAAMKKGWDRLLKWADAYPTEEE